MSRRWSEPILWKTKTGTILGLCVLPYAVLAMILNWYLFGVQRASEGWPNVTGIIIHSERTGRLGFGRRFHKVEYTFVVDGKEYTGDRVRAKASNVWPFGGNRWAPDSPFPVGSTVPVWYDPADPGNCVLRPGTIWGDTLMAWFATVICIIMFEPWWLWDRVMYGKDYGEEEDA